MKGARNGALAATFYGAGWFVIGATENIDYGLVFGLMATGCGAMVFIPPSTLLGYLKGLSKDKKAIEYEFYGTNEWNIL